MEDGILTLLKTYLPAWAIVAGLIIFFTALLFKEARDAISNIKLPKFFKTRCLKIESLYNHQFFIFINYMLQYKIDRLEFGCEGRTKVFRAYLKTRCEIFNTKTKELLKEETLDLSPAEIKSKIFNTLYTSISETTETMLDSCNNDEERDVVSFMIDKFNKHADANIEAFTDVIEIIFDSGAEYEKNIDKLNSMLNVLLYAFVATFANLESVLFKVNGYLSGKHYRGILIK